MRKNYSALWFFLINRVELFDTWDCAFEPWVQAPPTLYNLDLDISSRPPSIFHLWAGAVRWCDVYDTIGASSRQWEQYVLQWEQQSNTLRVPLGHTPMILGVYSNDSQEVFAPIGSCPLHLPCAMPSCPLFYQSTSAAPLIMVWVSNIYIACVLFQQLFAVNIGWFPGNYYTITTKEHLYYQLK